MDRSIPARTVIRRHRSILLALAIVDIVGLVLNLQPVNEPVAIALGFHLIWLACLWLLAQRFSIVAIMALLLVVCCAGPAAFAPEPYDYTPGLWTVFGAQVLAAGYGLWLVFGDLLNWSRVPAALDDLAARWP